MFASIFGIPRTSNEDAFCDDGEVQRLGQCADRIWMRRLTGVGDHPPDPLDLLILLREQG
jgi:hypothetical protein